MKDYSRFKIDIENYIANVAINRPDKANSLDKKAWLEMRDLFKELDENKAVRVIVLSGEGKHFCAGIDLALLMDIQQFQSISCESQKREELLKFIKILQECTHAVEVCRKPVLAAMHKGVIGGGVDITSACDMRYCTEDAYFTIKEIDMGLVADLGTLQRLPKLISHGLTAELAFTGRKMFADEAKACGLVNQVFSDKDVMLVEVGKIAKTIASKSPVVVRGIKKTLIYSRDHNVPQGLDQIAQHNSSMLLSNDLMEAFQATMQKREAVFGDS